MAMYIYMYYNTVLIWKKSLVFFPSSLFVQEIKIEWLSLNFRLEWPVRTLSFSHDGKMLASASEDLIIDIAEVESGIR